MPATATTKSTFNLNAPSVQKALKDINTGWKIKLYFLFKLPSVFFWGGRVKLLTHQRCEMTMPFRWSTQNPFRSIYFAAQCGIAEFSTGALCKVAMSGRGKISMLVSDVHAEFIKKATSKTTFTCEDGAAVIATIDRAIETGAAQKLVMTSTGRMDNGDVVSVTRLTWSFKVMND